ncbi:MAG: hypothetical protein HFP81_08845 [Methylococcales symbiont of Hymedesmia sp. n. MRB-2018]|nr:MAG: hypothetical protein HFP78_09360 [Methylococcales symbiont of Hymedesmia sp. n. MRB-2018]KAF3983071.1 MAG: hypothetical protein HFP81_08845 [Methylococcales symbiont of Hymedesmia sp. n. MRB-2018]
MDQDLKQRLVGTVVITALAAIFVPMLFDEPIDDDGENIRSLKIPDAPVQAYASTSLPDSIEDVIALPDPVAIKIRVPAPVPAVQHASKKQSWFIQVGIFGQESNAQTLKNTIIKQGFPVVVTQVSTEEGLLYRVRVGPELDKKRAESIKAKVDKINGIKGILALSED